MGNLKRTIPVISSLHLSLRGVCKISHFEFVVPNTYIYLQYMMFTFILRSSYLGTTKAIAFLIPFPFLSVSFPWSVGDRATPLLKHCIRHTGCGTPFLCCRICSEYATITKVAGNVTQLVSPSLVIINYCDWIPFHLQW